MNCCCRIRRAGLVYSSYLLSRVRTFCCSVRGRPISARYSLVATIATELPCVCICLGCSAVSARAKGVFVQEWEGDTTFHFSPLRLAQDQADKRPSTPGEAVGGDIQHAWCKRCARFYRRYDRVCLHPVIPMLTRKLPYIPTYVFQIDKSTYVQTGSKLGCTE